MATADGSSEVLLECFWPGVRPTDLRPLDERAAACVAALAADGESVAYLGSLLMDEDEVVLCRFAGSEAAVVRVAQSADIPFTRLLLGTRSPRSCSPE